MDFRSVHHWRHHHVWQRQCQSRLRLRRRWGNQSLSRSVQWRNHFGARSLCVPKGYQIYVSNQIIILYLWHSEFILKISIVLVLVNKSMKLNFYWIFIVKIGKNIWINITAILVFHITTELITLTHLIYIQHQWRLRRDRGHNSRIESELWRSRPKHFGHLSANRRGEHQRSVTWARKCRRVIHFGRLWWKWKGTAGRGLSRSQKSIPVGRS